MTQTRERFPIHIHVIAGRQRGDAGVCISRASLFGESRLNDGQGASQYDFVKATAARYGAQKPCVYQRSRRSAKISRGHALLRRV